MLVGLIRSASSSLQSIRHIISASALAVSLLALAVTRGLDRPRSRQQDKHAGRVAVGHHRSARVVQAVRLVLDRAQSGTAIGLAAVRPGHLVAMVVHSRPTQAAAAAQLGRTEPAMRDRMEVPVLVGLAGRGTQGRAVAVVLDQRRVRPETVGLVLKSTAPWDLAAAAAAPRRERPVLAGCMAAVAVAL